MTHDEPSATPNNPPSFAPKPQRRSSQRSSGNAPSQSTSRSSQEATPPSFSPRTRNSNTARANVTPDATRVQQPAQAPASIPPRASRGSSSQPSSSRSRATVPSSTRPSRSSQPSTPPQQPRNPQAPRANVARRAHHPHRVRNVIVGVLVVIVLILGIGTFSVWNWVNGNLHKEAWLTNTPDNTNAQTWLILGTDERDGTTGSDDTPGERTDTILVLVKPKHGSSALISIPRDSLVEVDGVTMKINAVMQDYGRQELVNQVEEVTGLKIDHVAKLTFGGLTGVVDALGGVELCYDQDVDDEKSDLHWQAGCHVANGQTALAFSRMRYSDPRGDFGRAERQRQVIAAIAKKGASRSTLLNIGRIRAVGDAALHALTVDDHTSPKTLLDMLLAFRDASGSNGITGSLYWSDPDYYVDGVGSSVLLDENRNLALFKAIADGTEKPGRVGSAAENA